MASINYAVREISIKVVYYGPGLSGKTTNLQIIHRKIPVDYRSDMVSLATETDRTLFFDFLPLDLGKIKGFSTKFQLYTVPGQVYYNATRKLVLRGVDGVVFVADSAQDKMQENLESFQNLHDNLSEYGYAQGSIPIVIQYNKRDLPNAMPVEQLDRAINKFNYPSNEAMANQGKGVFESLKIIGKIVIDTLNKKYSRPTYNAAPAQPTPSAQGALQRPPVATEPAAYAPPQRQQQKPIPTPKTEQPIRDIFQNPASQPNFSKQNQPLQQPPASPQAPEMRKPEYYDYGAINLEPMADQPDASQDEPEFNVSTPPRSSGADKTELDFEIEKYQREIEEKQQRLRNLQQSSTTNSPKMPQPQHNPEARFPSPQHGNYDVYEPLESDQIPQYPPQRANDDMQVDAEDEQPLYFTSVNTDRQRKKIKRPVNPKSKVQGGFFTKFFNKDKPE